VTRRGSSGEIRGWIRRKIISERLRGEEAIGFHFLNMDVTFFIMLQQLVKVRKDQPTAREISAERCF